MKLFHLSDLHIGKIVNGYEMWEDQRYVFDQILAYVREEQPDALIIAGDIYDKAVPSAKAVTEFDEFLTELADSGTIILIISGNHDSAERLDFASSIMKKQNIYMKGTYGGEAMKVTMQDKWEFLSDAVCKAGKRKKYIIGFNRRTGERVSSLNIYRSHAAGSCSHAS